MPLNRHFPRPGETDPYMLYNVQQTACLNNFHFFSPSLVEFLLYNSVKRSLSLTRKLTLCRILSSGFSANCENRNNMNIFQLDVHTVMSVLDASCALCSSDMLRYQFWQLLPLKTVIIAIFYIVDHHCHHHHHGQEEFDI